MLPMQQTRRKALSSISALALQSLTGAGAMSLTAAQARQTSGPDNLQLGQGPEQAAAVWEKQHITNLLVNSPPGGMDLLTGYISKRGDFLALVDRGRGGDAAAFVQTIAQPFADVLRHSVEQADLVDQSPVLSRPAPPELLEWDGWNMVVPPNSVCTYDQRGMCMDPALPAPGQGDALTLVPVTARVPPEMEPLYSALGKWVAANPSEEKIAQKLTWTVMGAGTESAFATNVTPQTLRELDAVMPGGAAAFTGYHQSQILQKRILGHLLKGTGLDRVLTADQLLGANAKAGIDTTTSTQLMARLTQLGKQGSEGKGYGYNMVTGGLATRAQGSATLTAQVDLLNSSDQPVAFAPMTHFAQPSSRKQGISSTAWMAEPARRISTVGIRGSAGSFNFDKSTNFNKELLANLTWLMNLDDIRRHWSQLGGGSGGGLMASSRLSSNRQVGPTRKALANQVEANPLIGNVLAMVERATGKSWLSR